MNKKIEWILRLAVFGEFLGHGVFALQGKQAWIGWIEQILGVNAATAGTILFLIGLMDVAVALVVLVFPVKIVLLWGAVWGLWTALVRPIVGEPIWDFVERWANWGAPLALFYLRGGTIKNWKSWCWR